MKKIEEMTKEKRAELEKYYDALSASICIQKYIETEDGKGDFIPVYMNPSFRDSMGVPQELIYKLTLRQVSPQFPEKQINEMKDVAFNGTVVNGDSFSPDYSKFFSVRIYQYQYGYAIMFMTDVTLGHINKDTFLSISRVYEEIYYMRISEPMCSKVYPILNGTLQYKAYDEIIETIKENYQIHPEDVDLFFEFFNKESMPDSLKTVNDKNLQFRGKVQDGSYKWFVSEVIANEKEGDELVSFVIAIRNIDEIVKDERKKREELADAYEKAKKANESKNKFLTHMSHDLRTPLNGILGMIELLETGNVTEEERINYRDIIKHSTENLLTLFNEVLEITRLDSGDFKLEKRSFDLNHVKDAVSVFLKNHDTELIVDFNEIMHPYRIGSEEYIRQIVLQLVTNAIKFNKKDNPIEITVKEIGGTDEVILIVKDYGVGISEEFKDQVFEPFTQEYGDSRTVYEGSGLGLAYVKRIIDEMGGEIVFDSVSGEGSTFTVKIPIPIDVEREHSIEKRKQVCLANKKALIVEDNEINMMIMECFLEKENVIADKAENGKIALDKFVASKENEYDFILMDILMPVMNGLDATKAIRKSDHPNAKTVPIIAVSANSFPEDIAKGFEAGMTAYLSKPISRDALFETIESNIE